MASGAEQKTAPTWAKSPRVMTGARMRLLYNLGATHSRSAAKLGGSSEDVAKAREGMCAGNGGKVTAANGQAIGNFLEEVSSTGNDLHSYFDQVRLVVGVLVLVLMSTAGTVSGTRTHSHEKPVYTPPPSIHPSIHPSRIHPSQPIYPSARPPAK
jgi:hypothetical protein